MLCPLCKGAGSLLTTKPNTWWECAPCGGTGVIAQHGPAVIICRGFNIPPNPKKWRKRETQHA